MIEALATVSAFIAVALSLWHNGHHVGVERGEKIGFDKGREWERESYGE